MPLAFTDADGELALAVLEALPEPLIVLETSRERRRLPRLRYANAAFARLIGCSRGALRGRSLAALLAPERGDAGGRAGLAAGLSQGRAFRARVRLKRSGRPAAAAEIAFGPLGGRTGGRRWLGRVCVPGATRLVESEVAPALEPVFGGAPVAFHVEDASGRFVYVNPDFAHAFGHARTDLVGRLPGRALPRRLADAWRARGAEARRSKRAVINALPVAREDGAVTWHLMVSFPLLGGDGEVHGVAGVCIDLAEAVREADLVPRRPAAEGETARYLAAASHDLRQPLQAARMFTGALRRRLAGSPQAALAGHAEEALDAASELLSALLDVSKLEAGAVQPEIRPFSVGEALARLEAEWHPRATARGVHLKLVPTEARVRSDPVLFERLLRNLVSNAVQYTPAGGKVVIGCRREGRRGVRLEVWDNGPGIPEDQREAIFAEFYRLDRPGTPSPPGVGIGLAVVRRVAALLDHRVGVRSWPGRGSVFSVLLPRARARRVPPRSPAETNGAEARASVVIIDDDARQLEALRLVLEGWGFRVIVAASPEEARARLKQVRTPPSIVIADYWLTEAATGTAAAAEIRARFGARLPVIVLTGDTRGATRREARGVLSVVLHKPVAPERLRRVLDDLLSRADERKAPRGPARRPRKRAPAQAGPGTRRRARRITQP